MILQKTFHKPQRKLSLFGDSSLVALISIVTLLLQLISFVTTWNGSKIYLDGVFPYASLLFAIAIQATAYFFSNSLRGRLSFLKIVALCAALCCSTYYSYIGIYNSVNSPVSYLQESYISIRQDLTQTFQEELEETISSAIETVNDAASLVAGEYSALTGEQQNIAACRDALTAIKASYTNSMRAPKQSAYENYEDYAAAYQAYINSTSQGNNVEREAARSNVLSSYGFASMEDLNAAEQENTAAIIALKAALEVDIANTSSADEDTINEAIVTENTTENTHVLNTISMLSGQLSNAINTAAAGQPFDTDTVHSLNQLLQAAKLCGFEAGQLSTVTTAVNQCAKVSATALMAEYPTLVASLPEGTVTSGNTMELKNAMDSEILSALLKINTLLPKREQLSISDTDYEIIDLYLLPITALQSDDTKMTSFFSLGVAALIDSLSLLFAVSLRGRKPLWKRHTLLFNRLEDYAPLIFASLPENTLPVGELAAFLSHFQPSPETEGDGYMLMAPMDTLTDYGTLAALLCQVNLAKIVPADQQLLLLRARFVFWANSVIYEQQTIRNEAAYE